MDDRYKGYRISSTRLPGYDYGQNGAYFVTICTKNRICFFGDIVVETQYLASPQNIGDAQNIGHPGETQNIASLRATEIGRIAHENWLRIPEHFPFVKLDESIIMPNHIHGIIIIDKPIEVNNRVFGQAPYKNKFGPQSNNLSSILRGYKASVKTYATSNKIDFAWQSRFHDSIIRDEDARERIKKYIKENPENWWRDKNNDEGLFM